ncbi:uncharacterized protein BDV14DRAFT_163181 [Aspergillus stella-maris]|uniref:uncharacterized protein n=1 Tax=Aspergillus stella-maris TaxID=1810926 RepID=UPI003CCCB2AD
MVRRSHGEEEDNQRENFRRVQRPRYLNVPTIIGGSDRGSIFGLQLVAVNRPQFKDAP